VFTEGDCTLFGGMFQGKGTSCEPNQCPQGCCFPDGSCQLLVQSQCSAQGGIPQEIGTGCPVQKILEVIHTADQWTHIIRYVSLCPGQATAGAEECAKGADQIDPWVTGEGGVSMNCEDFGHPSACAIPAGFFGEGSDAFDGIVCFQGAPIGPVTLPGFDEELDFGDADTLVRRFGDPFDRCDLPAAESQMVSIAIERLNLLSVEPMTVTYNGGGDPEEWNVAVRVLTSAGQPGGTLTATKTHCNGGTFDSILAVCPTFLFTRVRDGMQLELDFCTGCNPSGIVMTTEGVSWVHDVEPGLGAVSPVCSDFHPGISEPGAASECDCNENGSRDLCDIEAQSSRDCDGDAIPDECQPDYCAPDINCDQVVDVDDLIALILNWGCTTPPGPCPGDVNRDGVTDVDDLVALILEWGPCQ
jgi:hypothetical protein